MRIVGLVASEYGDLINHWWNGQWGGARKDIWVYRDKDRWNVIWYSRADKQRFKRLNTSEIVARAYVKRLIEIAPVPPPREHWRDIAVTHGSGRSYD